MGGKEKNKHSSKKIKSGRGMVGKTAGVSMKDRDTNTVQAVAVEPTDRATFQGFVTEHITDGTKVYTDEHSGYVGLDNHENARHSVMSVLAAGWSASSSGIRI